MAHLLGREGDDEEDFPDFEDEDDMDVGDDEEEVSRGGINDFGSKMQKHLGGGEEDSMEQSPHDRQEILRRLMQSGGGGAEQPVQPAGAMQHVGHRLYEEKVFDIQYDGKQDRYNPENEVDFERAYHKVYIYIYIYIYS